jgi:hypothetical protein
VVAGAVRTGQERSDASVARTNLDEADKLLGKEKNKGRREREKVWGTTP